MRDVYVLGVGMIKFGRYPDKDVPQLGGDAALRAPPPRSPILPICSTPTAMVTSYIPEATPMYASRNAVEPVAQAFETLITGMPVWPICCKMRWPFMALA